MGVEELTGELTSLEDLASEREAVGVEAVGGKADEHVPRLDAGQVGHGAGRHQADDEPGEVVVAEGVEAGQLGGFASQQ